MSLPRLLPFHQEAATMTMVTRLQKSWRCQGSPLKDGVSVATNAALSLAAALRNSPFQKLARGSMVVPMAGFYI